MYTVYKVLLLVSVRLNTQIISLPMGTSLKSILMQLGILESHANHLLKHLRKQENYHRIEKLSLCLMG